MMLLQSRRRRAFALSLASCCVLFSARTKILAEPAVADIPSTAVALEPRNVDQQIKLAGDYLAGRGVERNLKLAAYWYEKAAGAGDPQAELQIGYFYEAGIGVSKDPTRAAHWYRLAASGGLVRAKVNLAVAYLWGTGVPTNQKLALKLLNEAAADGSGLAACYLGDFYAFGIGVPVDQAAAERWYRRGAGLHDPLAEFDLGTLLFSGSNHTHDLSAAASFFRESAAAGYVPAMHSLGLLLVRNPALAQSPGEAMELLNHAANAGNWRSSMLLGVLVRDGNGVPKDLKAAYYHFRVACLQGGDEPKKLLATDLQLLSTKLGSFQAQNTGSEAEQWFSQHHFALAFVDRGGETRGGFPVLALADPGNGEHAAPMLTSPIN